MSSRRARPRSSPRRRPGGLLDGIDASTLVGLRDRAFLGVLVYSFARVSAAVSLRVADYYTQGRRSFFRLTDAQLRVLPAPLGFQPHRLNTTNRLRAPQHKMGPDPPPALA